MIPSNGGEQTKERGTTVQRVVNHLREGIFHSRYAPGQRLIEADLTRELAVSRGPVREAFRRLAAEGLIESVPNRGAVVRRLSRRETIELFEIRLALEELAVRRAADRIDEDGNRERFLAAIAPIWDDAPRVPSAYIEENTRFHQAILDASGSRQLAEVSRQLQLPLIMFQQSRALTPEILRDSVHEHREIANAILAGDGIAAVAAVRGHLGRATELSRQMSSEIFRPED